VAVTLVVYALIGIFYFVTLTSYISHVCFRNGWQCSVEFV